MRDERKWDWTKTPTNNYAPGLLNNPLGAEHTHDDDFRDEEFSEHESEQVGADLILRARVQRLVNAAKKAKSKEITRVDEWSVRMSKRERDMIARKRRIQKLK